MNPSKPNTHTGASRTETEPIGLTNTGQMRGLPTDSNFQSSHHSAPLLPSGLYNPGVTSLEPPSYESVVAQDASDLNNRFGLSSTGNRYRAYNQAPYPTAPGLHSVATHQATYPRESGYTSVPVSTVNTQTEIGFINPATTEPRLLLVGLRPKGFGEVTAPKPESRDQEPQEQFDHAARQAAEKQEKILTVIIVLGLISAVAAVLALIKRVMTIHS